MRATVAVCVLLALGCEKSPPEPVAALPAAPVEAASPVPTSADRTPVEPSPPVPTAVDRTPAAPTPTAPIPRPAPVEPPQIVPPTATADAAATPAPAPARDAAYFDVSGRGLVRLSAAGVEVLYEDTSFPLDLDFAVTDDGLVHLAANGRLFVIADGQRREIAVPPHMRVGRVAHATDRSPVIASDVSILRRRGDGWAPSEAMDSSVPRSEAEQPQQIVTDSDDAVWARGQQSLFHSGPGGFKKERLPLRSDLNIVAIAIGGNDIVAAVTSDEVYVRRTLWQRYDQLLGKMAFYSVAVGPDETAVVGASDSVAMLARGAEPQPVQLDDTGMIIALARDARSRTWVVGTNKTVILGPDNAELRRWPTDEVPGLGGGVRTLKVTGQGPELPAQ